MTLAGSGFMIRREVVNPGGDDVEEQINREGVAAKHEVRILLLGAGKSENLSRFCESIPLYRNGGYNSDERKKLRKDVFAAMIQAFQNLLKLDHLVLVPSNEIHRRTILDLPEIFESDVLPSGIVDAMHDLYRDPHIQKLVNGLDSTDILREAHIHYLKSIDRITKDNYVPSDEDILNRYIPPRGIDEVNLRHGEAIYKLVHIRRQDGTWSKWIHCFDGVKAIGLFVNLGGYHQSTDVMGGEQSVNYMHDALEKFDLICNSEWFKTTTIILFFDDKDLSKKLFSHPLKDFFPDFDGGPDYDAACDYLLHTFVRKNRSSIRAIYANYITRSNDLEQVEFLLSAMQDILLQEHMRQNRLL